MDRFQRRPFFPRFEWHVHGRTAFDARSDAAFFIFISPHVELPVRWQSASRETTSKPGARELCGGAV